MKIAFAVQNYPPAFGGSEFLVKNLAENFTSRFGHKCVVLTSNAYSCDAFNSLDCPKMPAGITAEAGVTVRRFNVNPEINEFVKKYLALSDKYNFPFNELARMYKRGPRSLDMFKAIISEECDALILTSFPLFHIGMGYIAKKLFDKKIIINGSFHINDEAYENELNRMIARSADGYVCNSPAEYDYFTGYGVNSDKMIVIPPAVIDLPADKLCKSDAKKILNISSGKLILYFGQIFKNKNIELLINGFCKFIENGGNATLIIAGGGFSGYYNILLQIINDFPDYIRSKIIIKINIDDAEKNILYSAADVYVTPTISESLGLSMIEAWAYKIPVMANGIDQLKYIINNGKNGILFEKNNPDRLADGLLEVLNNRGLSEVLAEEGHYEFMKKYDKNTNIEKYDEFVRKIINA